MFAWLRVVAYHEVLRLGRVKRGEPSLEAELALPAAARATLERLPRLADPHDTESAREALRLLAGLRWRRRVLALPVAGFSYREICERLGVSCTWVNQYMTEGRAELRRAA